MGISSILDLDLIDGAAIDRLVESVGGARDRCERREWSGSARSLHARKYGEEL